MADPSGSINNHAFGGIGATNTYAWLKDDDKEGLGGLTGAASVAMSSEEAFRLKYDGADDIFSAAKKIRPENV